MHDPMVVAHDIPLPLPRRDRWREKRIDRRWGLIRQRRTNPENLGEPVYPWWRPRGWTVVAAGRVYRMRHLATIWHVEPGGRDSGSVCTHYLRGDAWRSLPRWRARLNPFIKPLDGGEWAADRSWKWHVWHWHIQVHALQHLRARLFDRCTLCRRKGRPNVSHGWDNPALGWWKFRSRQGLYHMECSSLVSAQRQGAVDEHLIRHLLAALRLARDESETEAIDRLADGLDFVEARRLWTILGYERDDSYALVKKPERS
jgi:hypothetical protein